MKCNSATTLNSAVLHSIYHTEISFVQCNIATSRNKAVLNFDFRDVLDKLNNVYCHGVNKAPLLWKSIKSIIIQSRRIFLEAKWKIILNVAFWHRVEPICLYTKVVMTQNRQICRQSCSRGANYTKLLKHYPSSWWRPYYPTNAFFNLLYTRMYC